MIHSFRTSSTENVFDGAGTRAARQTCPEHVWKVARRKLDQINRVERLEDLAEPPANRLEALRGSRRGQYSIRINQRYRICFTRHKGSAHDVEIVDYH